jgi:hypothetical protein
MVKFLFMVKSAIKSVHWRTGEVRNLASGGGASVNNYSLFLF